MSPSRAVRRAQARAREPEIAASLAARRARRLRRRGGFAALAALLVLLLVAPPAATLAVGLLRPGVAPQIGGIAVLVAVLSGSVILSLPGPRRDYGVTFPAPGWTADAALLVLVVNGAVQFAAFVATLLGAA